jgi:hypothetical protein
MKKNILLVNEKWCDGKISMNFSNSAHNVINTFKKTQQHNFNTIHLDEAEVVYSQHIDEVLISYCNNNSVDIFL